MHSIRVGVFRPFARVGAIATPLAIIAMLLMTNAAFAATIGSTGPSLTTCNLGLDLVQTSTAPISPSYVVGADGVITEWSTFTGPALGQIGLEVWRLSTAPATYQLVGASPLVTPLAINTPTSFPLVTSIPVLAGDLLGLRLEGPGSCLLPGGVGDTLGYFSGPNPALLSTETMNVYPVASLLNVSATVGTVPPPPPPPPPPGTGCDQTGDQSGDQTGDQTGNVPGHSNGDHADGSKAGNSSHKSGDKSDKNSCDKGNSNN